MRLTAIRRVITEAAEEDIRAIQFAGLIHGLVYSYLNAFGVKLNWGFESAYGNEPVILQDMEAILSRGGIKAAALKPYAPDWYDPQLMDQLIIVLGPPTENRSGAFGIMTDNRRPGIAINIMDPENPLENLDKKFKAARRIFVHEFTHFLDHMRTHATRKRDGGTASLVSDDGNYTEYYSNPAEFNAYFSEAASELLAWLEQQEDQKTRQMIFWGGFEDFLRFMMDHLFPPKYRLLPKFDRKIKKRFYKLYTELVQRERARAA